MESFSALNWKFGSTGIPPKPLAKSNNFPVDSVAYFFASSTFPFARFSVKFFAVDSGPAEHEVKNKVANTPINNAFFFFYTFLFKISANGKRLCEGGAFTPEKFN